MTSKIKIKGRTVAGKLKKVMRKIHELLNKAKLVRKYNLS